MYAYTFHLPPLRARPYALPHHVYFVPRAARALFAARHGAAPLLLTTIYIYIPSRNAAFTTVLKLLPRLLPSHVRDYHCLCGYCCGYRCRSPRTQFVSATARTRVAGLLLHHPLHTTPGSPRTFLPHAPLHCHALTDHDVPHTLFTGLCWFVGSPFIVIRAQLPHTGSVPVIPTTVRCARMYAWRFARVHTPYYRRHFVTTHTHTPPPRLYHRYPCGWFLPTCAHTHLVYLLPVRGFPLPAHLAVRCGLPTYIFVAALPRFTFVRLLPLAFFTFLPSTRSLRSRLALHAHFACLCFGYFTLHLPTLRAYTGTVPFTTFAFADLAWRTPRLTFYHHYLLPLPLLWRFQFFYGYLRTHGSCLCLFYRLPAAAFTCYGSLPRLCLYLPHLLVPLRLVRVHAHTPDAHFAFPCGPSPFIYPFCLFTFIYPLWIIPPYCYPLTCPLPTPQFLAGRTRDGEDHAPLPPFTFCLFTLLFGCYPTPILPPCPLHLLPPHTCLALGYLFTLPCPWEVTLQVTLPRFPLHFYTFICYLITLPSFLFALPRLPHALDGCGLFLFALYVVVGSFLVGWFFFAAFVASSFIFTLRSFTLVHFTLPVYTHLRFIYLHTFAFTLFFTVTFAFFTFVCLYAHGSFVVTLFICVALRVRYPLCFSRYAHFTFTLYRFFRACHMRFACHYAFLPVHCLAPRPYRCRAATYHVTCAFVRLFRTFAAPASAIFTVPCLIAYAYRPYRPLPAVRFAVCVRRHIPFVVPSIYLRFAAHLMTLVAAFRHTFAACHGLPFASCTRSFALRRRAGGLLPLRDKHSPRRAGSYYRCMYPAFYRCYLPPPPLLRTLPRQHYLLSRIAVPCHLTFTHTHTPPHTPRYHHRALYCAVAYHHHAVQRTFYYRAVYPYTYAYTPFTTVYYTTYALIPHHITTAYTYAFAAAFAHTLPLVCLCLPSLPCLFFPLPFYPLPLPCLPHTPFALCPLPFLPLHAFALCLFAHFLCLCFCFAFAFLFALFSSLLFLRFGGSFAFPFPSPTTPLPHTWLKTTRSFDCRRWRFLGRPLYAGGYLRGFYRTPALHYALLRTYTHTRRASHTLRAFIFTTHHFRAFGSFHHTHTLSTYTLPFTYLPALRLVLPLLYAVPLFYALPFRRIYPSGYMPRTRAAHCLTRVLTLCCSARTAHTPHFAFGGYFSFAVAGIIVHCVPHFYDHCRRITFVVTLPLPFILRYEGPCVRCNAFRTRASSRIYVAATFSHTHFAPPPRVPLCIRATIPLRFLRHIHTFTLPRHLNGVCRCARATAAADFTYRLLCRVRRRVRAAATNIAFCTPPQRRDICAHFACLVHGCVACVRACCTVYGCSAPRALCVFAGLRRCDLSFLLCDVLHGSAALPRLRVYVRVIAACRYRVCRSATFRRDNNAMPARSSAFPTTPLTTAHHHYLHGGCVPASFL